MPQFASTLQLIIAGVKNILLYVESFLTYNVKTSVHRVSIFALKVTQQPLTNCGKNITSSNDYPKSKRKKKV